MQVRKMPDDHKKGNKWRAGLSPTNGFDAGHIPWNKDIKGIHLSPNTEFKKGCKSLKKLPIGTISLRQRKNRKESARFWIKIKEPNVWILNAVYVWKKHRGEIPKGNTIHHKDRNTMNDKIGNLESLTRAEHLEEHRKEHKRQPKKTSKMP
jgi:hypothetical protein